MNASSNAPDDIADLISVYGSPSQAGFGSAVFYEVIEPEADLESVALRYYQHFESVRDRGWRGHVRLTPGRLSHYRRNHNFDFPTGLKIL